MERIIKDGKEFLRFRIADEFEYLSYGKLISKMENKFILNNITPTLNNLLEIDWTNLRFSEKFKFPFYDSSTKNNHISGYCKFFNFSGIGVKVSELGGFSKLVSGEMFVGKNSAVIVSKGKIVINNYIASLLNNVIPLFAQGTTQKMAMWSYYCNQFITIPANYVELSGIIQRVLDYKQLSKQLSKQLEDYKIAILQKADQEVKKHIELNEKDKYITFRIGDEFTAISGKGSFNELEQKGVVSITKNIQMGYVYPFYDSSTINRHIKGWSKEFNNEGSFLKQSVSGDAGSSIYVEGKVFIGDKAYLLVSERIILNDYIGSLFNSIIPLYKQGSVIPNAYFSYYENEVISIPANYVEISKIISKINNWQRLIEETTKKMEKYIDGVLQLSLKGATND